MQLCKTCRPIEAFWSTGRRVQGRVRGAADDVGHGALLVPRLQPEGPRPHHQQRQAGGAEEQPAVRPRHQAQQTLRRHL